MASPLGPGLARAAASPSALCSRGLAPEGLVATPAREAAFPYPALSPANIIEVEGRVMPPTALLLAYLMISPPSFEGSRPGEQREVAGIKLCWCPPGRFLMGSPPDEPERRPGEDRVEVTL